MRRHHSPRRRLGQDEERHDCECSRRAAFQFEILRSLFQCVNGPRRVVVVVRMPITLLGMLGAQVAPRLLVFETGCRSLCQSEIIFSWPSGDSSALPDRLQWSSDQAHAECPSDQSEPRMTGLGGGVAGKRPWSVERVVADRC